MRIVIWASVVFSSEKTRIKKSNPPLQKTANYSGAFWIIIFRGEHILDFLEKIYIISFVMSYSLEILLALVLLSFLFWRKYFKRVIFIIALCSLTVLIYSIFNPQGWKLIWAYLWENSSHTQEAPLLIWTWSKHLSGMLASVSAGKPWSLKQLSRPSWDASHAGLSFSALLFSDNELEIAAIMQLMQWYLDQPSEVSPPTFSSPSLPLEDEVSPAPEASLTEKEIVYTDWLFSTISEEF